MASARLHLKWKTITASEYTGSCNENLGMSKGGRNKGLSGRATKKGTVFLCCFPNARVNVKQV